MSRYQYFVQSFDPIFLKTYHELRPHQKTGFLVEKVALPEKHLDFLGYQPDFFNPEHILLTDQLMKELDQFKIDVYTWTVNTQKEYDKIADYPLNGVITDYPERFI